VQVADAAKEAKTAPQQLQQFHERLAALLALRSMRLQLDAIKVDAVNYLWVHVMLPMHVLMRQRLSRGG
jgi:hypothetical protein